MHVNSSAMLSIMEPACEPGLSLICGTTHLSLLSKVTVLPVSVLTYNGGACMVS